MKTKHCSKCGIEKELSEFYKHPTAKLGVRPDCKECRRKVSSKFYKENKIKIRQKHNDYYLENKPQCIKRNIKNNRLRARNNLNVRILRNCRSRLYTALKNERKKSSSINLLGCDSAFLKQHLESLFTKEMSWDNYGRGWYGKQEWHIDHIKPCIDFDLSKELEQRECFHYSNLQPLWAKENWSKGNKNR